MSKDAWLKLHTSILTSQKFISLPHNDHRQAYFILLLLAKKGLESAPESYLLGHLNLGKKRWKAVQKGLIKAGLLDHLGFVIGFEESQLSPEAWRKRQQRERDKQRDMSQEKSHENPRDSRMQNAECISKEPPKSPKGDVAHVTKKNTYKATARLILDMWNGKYNRKIEATGKIEARLKSGATFEDCRLVIDYKTKEWLGTEFAKFLQPSTLFAPTKFWDYLSAAKEDAEAPTAKPKIIDHFQDDPEPDPEDRRKSLDYLRNVTKGAGKWD